MKESFEDLEKLGAEALLGDPRRALLESPDAFVEAALSVLLDVEMRIEFRAHMRAGDEITAVGLTVDRAEELAAQVADEGVIALSPRDLADVFASRTVYDAVGAALDELDADVDEHMDERSESGTEHPWREAWLESILATPSAVEILRFDPPPSWRERWPRYALAALVLLAALAAGVLWHLNRPAPTTVAAERTPLAPGPAPLNAEPIPTFERPPVTVDSDEREHLESLADAVVAFTDEGRCVDASVSLARLRARAGEVVMADEVTRLARRVTRCLETEGTTRRVERSPRNATPEMPRRADAPTVRGADCTLDDVGATLERAKLFLSKTPSRAASRLRDVLACEEDPYVRAQLGYALERMGRPCEALVHYRKAYAELDGGPLAARVGQSIARNEGSCEK